MTNTPQQDRRRNRIFRWLMGIWIVVFSSLVILALVQQREASSQNRKRIDENAEVTAAIQRSRLESCRANYTSQLQAFADFKPKKDDPNTPRNEVADFKHFTDNLREKRANCVNQVKPQQDKPKVKRK